MKTSAVAYLRVSTPGQVEAGFSLDAQRAKVEAYADLYDLEIVGVHVDDGASGSTLDRPALAGALAVLESGQAQALIVSKLDRLTRSVRDLGELLDHFTHTGASLLSVGEQIDTRSAGGRLVLNVLTSVSQWEREAIGERTKVSLAEMRAQGLRTGTIPYGYRLAPDGRHLVTDDGEQAVITAARRLRARGLSLRVIARELTALGFVSRTGRVFGAAQISRMLSEGDA